MLTALEKKMIDHIRTHARSSIRSMASSLQLPKSTLFDYYTLLQKKDMYTKIVRIFNKNWFICWCVFPSDWKTFISKQKFANKVYLIYGKGYCVQFVFPNKKMFERYYKGMLNDYIWCTNSEECKFEQASISIQCIHYTC